MKEIQVDLTVENYSMASSFIEKELKSNGISKEIVLETLLVFEALYNRIIEQDCCKNSTIEISKKNKLGDLSITIGFEGKMFIPERDFNGELMPEDKIMKAYDDKLSYSYFSSYNTITLTVKRGQRKTLLFCAVGFLAAVLVYTILQFALSIPTQSMLLVNYIFPIEKLFTNAMLMIGAPVTFFSLVKNLMDTFIVAERSSVTRRLQPKTIITSIVAILLAVVSFFIYAYIINNGTIFDPDRIIQERPSFGLILERIVPSNIFEPFITFSPFPIIVVGVLAAYACCSVGKHFEGIKKAIDACYTFFSKMLSIVMCALPVFCFVAFLDSLISGGYRALLVILASLAFAAIGLILVLVFYYLRLKIRKIDVKHFAKNLWPLLKENFKINSAIDAVSYNTRYCVKNYGYDRKTLEESLPVLAQTNLDGNCLFIMLIGCSIMMFSNMTISPYNLIVLGIIVFFLSLGAPNQPGSVLIGVLIIIAYFNTGDYVCIAIYMEVILGSMQNIVNVLGDIVTVAADDARIKKLEAKANKNS